MRSIMSVLRISTLVLLFGCGGGEESGGGGGGGGTENPNIAGNWQVSMSSTASGISPMTLAGSITQLGSSVNGTVHIDGSNCFDGLTSVELTGTLTGSNVSLTSTSVDGQVLALTGRVTTGSLSGSYNISGGCANGDLGTIAGFKLPAFSGRWRSGFQLNFDENSYGQAMVSQDSAGPEGSFGISGSVDDSSNFSCFTGTITSGTFPFPSFILGTSVNLEIKTDDGTLVFLGTMSQDGSEIIGTHHIVGGKCDGFSGQGCFGRDFRSLCRL